MLQTLTIKSSSRNFYRSPVNKLMLYIRAQQQATPLTIEKNIFIVINFKKKDLKLYLAAAEPPDVAPVMLWVAGPFSILVI